MHLSISPACHCAVPFLYGAIYMLLGFGYELAYEFSPVTPMMLNLNVHYNLEERTHGAALPCISATPQR